MFCPKCGSQIPDNAAVCTGCGCSMAQQAPQQAYPQGGYQQPMMGAPTAVKLKTDRSLALFIILTIVTFGIYGLYVWSTISTDINTIASRYDGKNTMHYCLVAFVFSWLTFGIYPIIWLHCLSERIGYEQMRRGLPQTISAGSFWGWYVLGSFILVGPLVYMYKLLQAMNSLSADYNTRG